MSSRPLRTHTLARELGVHVNTIRLYEACGYFSDIPRGANGYRLFSTLHLEQARLAHLTLSAPYLGDKEELIELVKRAAQGDFQEALALAYRNLHSVRREILATEAALSLLERWAAGQVAESAQEHMHIKEAARYLSVTEDMLRNWDRNGLIMVPRDPTDGSRLYGPTEIGRLRVIHVLVQSGYSLMAILRMLLQFDAGQTENLRSALEIPRSESDVEYIEIVADRWYTSLLQFERRAQAIISQLERLMQMTYSRE